MYRGLADSIELVTDDALIEGILPPPEVGGGRRRIRVARLGLGASPDHRIAA